LREKGRREVALIDLNVLALLKQPHVNATVNFDAFGVISFVGGVELKLQKA
jgi:hypothetical protein